MKTARNNKTLRKREEERKKERKRGRTNERTKERKESHRSIKIICEKEERKKE